MLALVITILSRKQLTFLNTSIRERDNANYLAGGPCYSRLFYIGNCYGSEEAF